MSMETKTARPQCSTTTLRSGQEMPLMGLGTFQLVSRVDEDVNITGDAVKAAIRCGYRLIDCAQGYNNQRQIGAALQELFNGNEVKREDLFIVSKIFNTHHAWATDEDPEARCFEALDTILSDLQVDYLDLLLIHWPFAFAEKALEKPPGVKQSLRLPDGSPNPVFTIKCEYLTTWRAMQKMVKLGKVRSIGVSNFTVEQVQHLENVSDNTEEIPLCVNQVEMHPYLPQVEMQEYCKKRAIKIMAYSPLGSSSVGRAPPEQGQLLEHPKIRQIAEKVKKTPAQCLIRWGLLKGDVISIPKSCNPKRILENKDVFDFDLPPETMASMNAMGCGFRCYVSYMNKKDKAMLWHDGKIENGDDSDIV